MGLLARARDVVVAVDVAVTSTVDADNVLEPEIDVEEP
jgi:hypothetical protein